MSAKMFAMPVFMLLFAAQAPSINAILIEDAFALYENNGQEAWKQQLQTLDDNSAGLVADFVGRVDPSWSLQKGSKNRYATTQPYAQNRIKLLPFAGEVEEEKGQYRQHPRQPRVVVPRKGSSSSYTDDYINASELKLLKAQRWYIVTQAPLNATIGDFWRMVYQQNVKSIVMLCHKEGTSCAVDYWPTPQNPTLVNGPLRATLIDRQQVTDDVIATTIQLAGRQLPPHNITHYHYMGWKDMQIPQMQSFVNLLRLVQPALRDTTSPSIVHCTAGVGRSGTFILVDSTLGMLENGYDVDASQQLGELRRMRYGLVETPEQLRFAYQAVMAARDAADNNKQ